MASDAWQTAIMVLRNYLYRVGPDSTITSVIPDGYVRWDWHPKPAGLVQRHPTRALKVQNDPHGRGPF